MNKWNNNSSRAIRMKKNNANDQYNIRSISICLFETRHHHLFSGFQLWLLWINHATNFIPHLLSSAQVEFQVLCFAKTNYCVVCSVRLCHVKWHFIHMQWKGCMFESIKSNLWDFEIFPPQKPIYCWGKVNKIDRVQLSWWKRLLYERK